MKLPRTVILGVCEIELDEPDLHLRKALWIIIIYTDLTDADTVEVLFTMLG